MSPTRRAFLGRVAGVASGSAAIAGCLSLRSDEEPPPIDVDESELGRIAAIELPDVPEEVPFDIGDGHLDAHRSRAEELLDAVPQDLGGIPNEAVRNYVGAERSDASAAQTRAAERESAAATLSSLTSARAHAAKAEGAYAAARGERVRKEVFETIDQVRDRPSALEASLERVGDEAHRAVLVYSGVETRLETAARRLDRADRVQPATSEVQAVGQAASRLESARAELDVVDHVVERRSGERSFDRDFERVARELSEHLEDRADVLPSDREDAGEQLFDAPVSDTPREWIGERIHRSRQRHGIDSVRDQLDAERSASALLALYALDHHIRTVEGLQARVADGAFDRPENGAEIRTAKQTAIDEVESIRDDSEYPRLIRHRLRDAVGSLAQGDRGIDRHSSDKVSVRAVGDYAVAIEQARAAPAATDWFVDQLP